MLANWKETSENTTRNGRLTTSRMGTTKGEFKKAPIDTVFLPIDAYAGSSFLQVYKLESIFDNLGEDIQNKETNWEAKVEIIHFWNA